MLLEGEINALTVAQAARDLVTPVATGGTTHARRACWIGRLAVAPLVLVAFDADANGAGDAAAAWWLNILANGKRWRPYWDDPNAMAQAGADVRGWVAAGLESAE
jgi:DNA primase